MSSEKEFNELLNNLYAVLDETSTESYSKKIPNPIISSFPRKVHWVNYYNVVKTMNRDYQHFSNYIISELGIQISMKNSNNIEEGIILHTKCREKDLKSLIGKYYMSYVRCKSCNSDDTILEKIPGISKLYTIKCQKCLASFNIS